MSDARTIRTFAPLLALLLASALPPAAAQNAPAPMGATVQGQGAARSVLFRVWAPNASHVGVAGDFNGW